MAPHMHVPHVSMDMCDHSLTDPKNEAAQQRACLVLPSQHCLQVRGILWEGSFFEWISTILRGFHRSLISSWRKGRSVRAKRCLSTAANTAFTTHC